MGGAVGVDGEHRAQHLVPVQHVGQRRPQGGHLQRAVQAQQHGHVVAGVVAFQAAQEPDPLLSR